MVAMMATQTSGDNLSQLSGLVDLLSDPAKAKKAIADMQAKIDELKKLKAAVDAKAIENTRAEAAFDKKVAETADKLGYRERDVTQREATVAAKEKTLTNVRDQTAKLRKDTEAELANLRLVHEQQVIVEKKALTEERAVWERDANTANVKLQADRDEVVKKVADLVDAQKVMAKRDVEITEREKAVLVGEAELKRKLAEMRRIAG